MMSWEREKGGNSKEGMKVRWHRLDLQCDIVEFSPLKGVYRLSIIVYLII